MRLFIGIEFPKEVLTELLKVQNQVRNESKSGRFVAKENLHLTLQFLGEVPEEKISEIQYVVSQAANCYSPFSLYPGQLGSFKNGDGFRVIWVGINGATKTLLQLQKALSDFLGEIGFAQEKRSYQPHITLARDVVFSKQVCLEKYGNLMTTIPFQVSQFSLIKSIIENKKRIYRSLYTFPLNGKELQDELR